jgi:HSP20 family protein
MVHPIELMHREFDDLLSRFFGGGGGAFGPSGTGALPAGMLAAALGTGYAVDVREDDKHIYIDADLPGFRKEDIDISIEGKTLAITAEHKEEIGQPSQQPQPQMTQAGQPQQGQQQAQQAGQPAQQPPQAGQGQKPSQQQVTRRAAGQEQQQKGQYLLRERRYERFTRSFSLPDDVDTQNVQAKLENGVLEITLNKSQQSQRTKIQVS